ncbi:MAG: CGGC domain-containing protein [Desulfobacteraceae bacterium]|nr:CGGC domain-containing protein [Desulfobacteraceae bacterium]MBC2756566.1 CGGC domain-containing protein [Desulfobacteraceae bacterium]
MTKVAIIRCEKNENRCPLTNCFKCMSENKQGFAGYSGAVPAGIFTCRCPGDNAADLGKILKSKGAEVIHFCTCAFAKKTDKGWISEDGGFCDHLEQVIEQVHNATGLPCVKGTAHLPEDYELETCA